MMCNRNIYLILIEECLTEMMKTVQNLHIIFKLKTFHMIIKVNLLNLEQIHENSF
jgi:hypothetical protein